MSLVPDPILFSIDGPIATITLNRPTRMNAFDAEMAHAWQRVTKSAVADESVAAIVLRAEGRAFCAGGDVQAMAEGNLGEDGLAGLAGTINDGILALLNSSVPVIAAVQGTTAGGGLGVLLASDYAIVEEEVRIGSLYADMGLTPDLSVTAQLARAVGQRRALQLVLTPRLLSAAEALDWGLVAEVVPVGTAAERAHELAGAIAGGATSAYGQAKRLIRSQPTRPLAEQLDEEAATIDAAYRSAEAQARIAAFAARSRKKAQA